MATVKVSTTKHANRAINYAHKRATVEQGYQCDVSNTKTEMATIRNLYAKPSGVQAHLVIQSFSPEESLKLGDQKINQIGLELAEKVAPNHQVAVYTHADKAHIHNHIVINAVNLETGEKFHQHNEFNYVKGLSDELVQAHGLKITQNNRLERQTMAERKLQAKGITPWKQIIRQAIDEAMGDSTICSYNQFRGVLSQNGIKVHATSKDVTFELSGANKRVRGAKLGADYQKQTLFTEFDRRTSMIERTNVPNALQKDAQLQREKLAEQQAQHEKQQKMRAKQSQRDFGFYR